jgi:hypothetical protein
MELVYSISKDIRNILTTKSDFTRMEKADYVLTRPISLPDLADDKFTPLFDARLAANRKLVGFLLHRPASEASDTRRSITKVWFSKDRWDASARRSRPGDLVEDTLERLHELHHWNFLVAPSDAKNSGSAFRLDQIFPEAKWPYATDMEKTYRHVGFEHGNNHPGGAGPPPGVAGPSHQV